MADANAIEIPPAVFDSVAGIYRGGSREDEVR